MFSVDDRILFYPVDRESLPIVKSTANYSNTRAYCLISPKSWGYEGECYECSDGLVAISHDYEKGLNGCSTVWIVDSWNEMDYKQFIELLNRYNYKGDMILHGIFDENKMAYAYKTIKKAMTNQ